MVKDKKNNILCENRKARFDYEIEEKLEVGIILLGYEVKALREGKGSIKSSFVSFKGVKGPILKNFQIGRYSKCSVPNIDKGRDKIILLKKKEIDKLSAWSKNQGHTVVPLDVSLNKGLIKISLGLVKGRKKYDKRQKIKERDIQKRARKSIGKL